MNRIELRAQADAKNYVRPLYYVSENYHWCRKALAKVVKKGSKWRKAQRKLHTPRGTV